VRQLSPARRVARNWVNNLPCVPSTSFHHASSFKSMLTPYKSKSERKFRLTPMLYFCHWSIQSGSSRGESWTELASIMTDPLDVVEPDQFPGEANS
jgi:hypothetical protein